MFPTGPIAAARRSAREAVAPAASPAAAYDAYDARHAVLNTQVDAAAKSAATGADRTTRDQVAAQTYDVEDLLHRPIAVTNLITDLKASRVDKRLMSKAVLLYRQLAIGTHAVFAEGMEGGAQAEDGLLVANRDVTFGFSTLEGEIRRADPAYTHANLPSPGDLDSLFKTDTFKQLYLRGPGKLIPIVSYTMARDRHGYTVYGTWPGIDLALLKKDATNAIAREGIWRDGVLVPATRMAVKITNIDSDGRYTLEVFSSEVFSGLQLLRSRSRRLRRLLKL